MVGSVHSLVGVVLLWLVTFGGDNLCETAALQLDVDVSTNLPCNGAVFPPAK